MSFLAGEWDKPPTVEVYLEKLNTIKYFVQLKVLYDNYISGGWVKKMALYDDSYHNSSSEGGVRKNGFVR